MVNSIDAQETHECLGFGTTPCPNHTKLTDKRRHRCDDCSPKDRLLKQREWQRDHYASIQEATRAQKAKDFKQRYALIDLAQQAGLKPQPRRFQ